MSGHDAAIAAMNTLLRPIIVTLVLMSVFLPAAFVPGLTGRMYAQFALVIAATPLLSAINAATLKPTQAVLWLRPPIPEERRNFFYRGFNAVCARIEHGYAGLIRRMVTRAGLMATIAFVIIASRPAGSREEISAAFSPRVNAPSDQRAPDGRLPGTAASTLDTQGQER